MPSISYCLPAKRRRNNNSRSKVNKNRKTIVSSKSLPIKLFSPPKIFVKTEDKLAVNAHLKDLRVQLIKLETIYDTFESYSASEVEMQTCNYIKLLKSSIFNVGSQVSNQQTKKDSFRTVDNQLHQKAFIVANISELFRTSVENENITFDEILNACNKYNNETNTSKSHVEQTLDQSNKVSKSSLRPTSHPNVNGQTTTKTNQLRNSKKTRFIKLEKMYDSAEDYSDSEISQQTHEYIDPLNSNSFNAFECGAVESAINEIDIEANYMDPEEPIEQKNSGLEALSSKADHACNEIECIPIKRDKKDSASRDNCVISEAEKISSVNLVDNSLKTPSKSNLKHAEFIPILDDKNFASKNIPLKDLRVQLIKLESISDVHENCSANKIELETHNKYFELLINSYSNCDPVINCQRPSGLDVKSIDKSLASNCLDLKDKGKKILRSTYSPENANTIDVEDMPLHYRLPLERKKESKPLRISKTLNTSTNRQKISKFKQENHGKRIPKMSPNTMVLIHEIKVECPICDKIFESEKILKIHYEKFHKNNDNLVINPIRKYKRYRKKITPSVKETNIVKMKWKPRYFEKSKCFICASTFETKESFFDHIKTHYPRKSQVCKKTKLQRSRSIEILLEDRTEEQQSDNYKVINKDCEERSVIELDLDNDMKQDMVSKRVQTVDHEYERTCAIAKPAKVLGTKSLITCPCHTLKTTNQDLQIEIVLFCKICDIVYRQQDCFLMHFSSSPKCLQMRSNRKITRIPKIVCTKCLWLFDSLQKMRTHLEIHALQNYQGPITFGCRICKIVFSNIGDDFHQHWYNHVKFPNLMASKYWFDSEIGESFDNMKTNENRKKSLSFSEYSCLKCKSSFNFRLEFEEHSQQDCENQRFATLGITKASANRQIIKIACSLCKKLYTGKERFDQHRKQCKFLMPPEVPFYRVFHCITGKTFICCFCSELASSIDEMNQHWQQVHCSLQELYTCKTCNIVPTSDPTIYTYQKFERHCLLKHDREVVTCLVCFISAKYFCSICKLKFSNLELLRNHELFHERT